MAQVITLDYPYDSSTIDIEIGSAKIDEEIVNPLLKVPIPILTEETVPKTWIVNLKTHKHTITIYGFLLSDSTSSALQKKEALVSTTTLGATHAEAPSSIGILKKRGDIKLTWRSETIRASFDKVKITDTSKRKDRAAYCSDSQYTTQGTCEGASKIWFPAGADKYEILLVLTRGEVRG